jgi:polar amino acid transport system substrate-binding protein
MRRLNLSGLVGGVLAVVVSLLLVFGSAEATAAPVPAQTEKTEIRVAIKPLDPFVAKAADNTYSGFSIELWNEIAKRNGWITTYVWNETVKDLLATVKSGGADAGIAGISMTAAREADFDFSYPMYNAGLQVMVGKSQKSTWRDSLRRIFSPTLFKILGIVFLLLIIVGHVIWLFNRHREDFPSSYVRGVPEGMWIAGETLMTQSTPRDPNKQWTRIVTFLWIFGSVIFVANITASISSQLTVASIEGRIRGIDDLSDKRIATVANTTAATELADRGFAGNVLSVDNVLKAYELLDSGKVDAIVYDAPVLQYRAQHSGKGSEKVVGKIFRPEPYGIAIPNESPLKEKIDSALLAMNGDGTYAALSQKYFGA